MGLVPLTVTVSARPVQIRSHHRIDVYTDINYLFMLDSEDMVNNCTALQLLA